ncbi:clustered mitochondria protein-like isoform X2 [Silene latifolia]|uniref:clustered mitochondria protein-like isoform X2 n=1 Tax=Silene latifolia TaxID=37657 RepID=UPI003D783D8B
MAGKTNKGKNRKGANSSNSNSNSNSNSDSNSNIDSTPLVVTSDSSEIVVDNTDSVVDVVAGSDEPVVEANGVVAAAAAAEKAVSEEPPSDSVNNRQGELHLYPVSVKTFGGDKLELQLNPGDSVMDVRQFLLDAPETCFFTCYDLLLHTKDGAVHSLEDYNEISEVADITTGDCSLEMVSAYYDDRSVRFHVHRTRELLSVSNIHASLSTSLALEHERLRSTSETKQDSVKAVPEIEGFDFMEDVTSCFSKLFPSSPKEIKCVESLVFSSLNPPPTHRRLVGDLIYLDVITLEGSNFCVSGTTQGFYVNSTAGNCLDPKPAKSSFEATTLIGLMQKISPKFKKAFKEILEQKASAHPFENVQAFLPPNSWLAPYPPPGHRRDAARAENAITLTYGSELIGMQRDWNEELQSCREFPHTTPQERILRNRALYKVTSDFVEAAMNGAVGVINKCIPPINPTDPECFHMYVHNNIFFSFAVDADLEQLPRKHKTNANVKNNITPVQHNSSGKIVDKISNAATDLGNGVESNGSRAEDESGVVIEPSDASEVQFVDTEQATYASANNDLKGTKAYQEADVPGLYNLAMAIIDYRGHRVVAQSVLPGILQGDKSDSLLYGSVDNGKKICWNEGFHCKVLEAANRLHLKEHSVSDEHGNVFKLAAPVECKGIVGSDDRHYLLDLMRVTPRDSNYTGPRSRFCILRPELISAFCQKVEAAKRLSSKSNCDEKDCLASEVSNGGVNADTDVQTVSCVPVTSDSQDISEEEGKATAKDSLSTTTETSDVISFNPNVFTEFKLAGSPEDIAADESSVKEASLYLTDVVLPTFIQDLCKLELSPMDGQTLTEQLHTNGINVRYIGKVAEGTKHMPHLWDLFVNEIAVRSAKHLLKDVLRDTEEHEVGPAISHFFNCFFGDVQTVPEKTSSNVLQRRSHKKAGNQKPTRGKNRSKNGAFARTNLSSYLGLCSERLWSEIVEFAKFKYQFDLPEDLRTRVRKVSVIRNLCQKIGASLAARKYDLGAESPFQTSDVVDLQPVVKHSVPVCSETKDLIDTGKAQLAEGRLSEAYTSFSEAFSTLQQVTGPMHREVANCCRYLAMVLYHAQDVGGAIMQQHKELIINERCLGLDHPDTAHSYGNMALFYHSLNETELALQHMSRALLLLSLSSGPDHPDVAATFINIAMMHQDAKNMGTALRYLQEALTKNKRLLGEEHVQTAVCYHALAIAFNSMENYKLSHQHEKKTHEILLKQLGEDDLRTRDSHEWMNTFKLRELQKKKNQALVNEARVDPDFWKEWQDALLAKGSGSSISLNSAQAAAAAVLKKKASSLKGNSKRSSQSSQLSNATSKNEEQVDKNVNQPTGQTAEDSSNLAHHQRAENDAPLGLGKGLGSLDSKRPPSKS